MTQPKAQATWRWPAPAAATWSGEAAIPEPVRVPLARFVAEESEGGTRIIVHRRAFEAPSVRGLAVRFERQAPVTGAHGGDSFWLASAGGGVIGDATAGTVDVFAPNDAWLSSPTFARTLLPLALVWSWAPRGVVYIHAAAVIDPGGTAGLLIGHGGAGKSTLTYSLVRRGWRYTSDDGLLLWSDAGAPTVSAFLDEVHLDRSLTRHFEELRFAPRLTEHPTKGTVPMDALWPDSFTPTCRPVRLLRLGAGDPAAPLRGRCLQALLADNLTPFLAGNPAHFEVLTDLVARCEVSEITATEALLTDPEGALGKTGWMTA